MLVLILVPLSDSQETGVRSKPSTQAYSAASKDAASASRYADGWERVFGDKHAVHPGSDRHHSVEDSHLCSVCNDKSLN